MVQRVIAGVVLIGLLSMGTNTVCAQDTDQNQPEKRPPPITGTTGRIIMV